jgi:hypothetical protein
MILNAMERFLNIILNPLSCIAPCFNILLCLLPDDFIHHWVSVGTQWVKGYFLVAEQT